MRPRPPPIPQMLVGKPNIGSWDHHNLLTEADTGVGIKGARDSGQLQMYTHLYRIFSTEDMDIGMELEIELIGGPVVPGTVLFGDLICMHNLKIDIHLFLTNSREYFGLLSSKELLLLQASFALASLASQSHLP